MYGAWELMSALVLVGNAIARRSVLSFKVVSIVRIYCDIFTFCYLPSFEME